MMSQVFVQAAIIALASAHFIKRFSVSDTLTGTVDQGVISDCTYWTTIQTGDSCSDIGQNFQLTLEQLVDYNPALKSDCTGLMVGHSYCVEENYGRGPANTITTTTTTTVTSKPTIASETTSRVPSPTQTSLISSCNAFYKVLAGDTCQKIVNSYGTFTLAQFYSWNPAVGQTCQALQTGYYVCVGVAGTSTTTSSTTTTPTSGPQPEQTGITKNCNKYYHVVSGDTCQGIVDKNGTYTLQQFYNWNPAVGSSCGSLLAGYWVCVGVTGTTTTKTITMTTTTASAPSPTQTGIVNNCTQYYQAVRGDTCEIIATQKFKTFSTAMFEQWNPAVGPECQQLFIGYYYCVAVSGTSTTSVSTPPPTSTAKGPEPQQSGLTPLCKTYYLVQRGDSCYSIEHAYHIKAVQFNRWNPGVGSECQNLSAGYYVCVGVQDANGRKHRC